MKIKKEYISQLKRTLASYLFLEQPLFVFGAGRSGTTLLHSLMDNHPDIVVWPFEFQYYGEFEKFRKLKKYSKNEKIPLQRLNEHFLSREDIQSFGKELHYSLNVFMNLEMVDKKVFYDFMTSFSPTELICQKDYLKLLLLAYYKSFCPGQPVKYFLVEVHGIRDEIIQDFPDAGYLWAYREPVDNYIAIKKDYFTSFDNKFFCYFPRVYIPSYRHGLLETALWPILNTHRWVKIHKKRIKLLKVDLKKLQKDPHKTMANLASSFGISFSETLLETSFAGVRFDSNLSSREKSKGKILQTKVYDIQENLTPYEYSFLMSKFYPSIKSKLKWVTRVKGFFALLKHEWPDKIMTTGTHKIPYLLRCVITILAFIAVYINNRFFFMFYKMPIDDSRE